MKLGTFPLALSRINGLYHFLCIKAVQLLRMDLDMAWIGIIHEIGETWQLLPAWAKDDSNFDDSMDSELTSVIRVFDDWLAVYFNPLEKY